jgi:hypothetical protein
MAPERRRSMAPFFIFCGFTLLLYGFIKAVLKLKHAKLVWLSVMSGIVALVLVFGVFLRPH